MDKSAEVRKWLFDHPTHITSRILDALKFGGGWMTGTVGSFAKQFNVTERTLERGFKELVSRGWVRIDRTGSTDVVCVRLTTPSRDLSVIQN